MPKKVPTGITICYTTIRYIRHVAFAIRVALCYVTLYTYVETYGHTVVQFHSY